MAQASDHAYLQSQLDQLSQIEDALRAYPQCNDVLEDQRPLCSEYTDNFCRNLWSKKNRGLVRLFDGKIQREKSANSNFDSIVLINQRALLDSLPRLPKDLAVELTPLFLKWELTLEKENDSKGWDKEIEALERGYRDALERVVDQRLEVRSPGLSKKRDEKYSPQERVLYNEIALGLEDEVTQAKYENHPNWKRAQSTFREAKADMLAAVNGLTIPGSVRDEMLAKLNEVELTLPLQQLGIRAKCGHTEVNATFYRSIKKFTLCAGFFNSFQSESVLYGTITHEMGHAIDADAFRYKVWAQSPVAQALSPLNAAPSGEGISCENWRSIKERLKTINPVAELSQRTPKLAKLYSCLKNTKNLDELTPSEIARVARSNTREYMDKSATQNYYLDLAVREYEGIDGLKENPSYLRPDLHYQMKNWLAKKTYDYSTFDDREIFSQELKCARSEEKGQQVSYDDASPKLREKLFAQALNTTHELWELSEKERITTCGKTCADLASENLGVAVGEEFADWISFRALNFRLKRMPSRMQQAMEASVLFSADLCEKPSIQDANPNLTLLQKERSSAEHGENRVRRISVFNYENAKLLGCRLDNEAKGFGTCEP